jgi:hypothetical protein
MTTNKRWPGPVLLAVFAIALLALAPGSSLAKTGKAKVRGFEGTVASVARDRHSFRIARRGHASVRIRVTRSTRRAHGARLRRGQAVRIKARRTRHGWVATKIARSIARGEDKSDAEDDPGVDEDDPAADDDEALEENEPEVSDAPEVGDEPSADDPAEKDDSSGD